MKLAALLTLSASFFIGVAIGAYAEWYYRANYLSPPRVDRDRLPVFPV